MGMPSEVDDEVGLFDRFAATCESVVSRAPFFLFCVLLVVIWAPSYFLLADIDTWQLIINTATTIITFLLVALLQNTQHRDSAAVHHKLNAIAQAMADMMVLLDPDDQTDAEELERAVGIEDHESST